MTVAFAGLLIYVIATVDGEDDETLARASGVGAVVWALAIVSLPLVRQAAAQVESATASRQKD